MILSCLWHVLYYIILSYPYDLDLAADCRNDLGMQSGDIKDENIHASSSYDEASVGPQNGR